MNPALNELEEFFLSTFRRYKDARDEVEEEWLEAWALYFGTPQSENQRRNDTIKTVGDVSVDWRHRISTGKCYENVETVLAYLLQATFPTRDWFNVEPLEPGDNNLLVARIIKRLTASKLEQGKFRNAWSIFLRQALITGNSCLALPWREDSKTYRVNKKHLIPYSQGVIEDELYAKGESVTSFSSAPSFECLDVFNVWLDPYAETPRRANLIRKFTLTKAELHSMVDAGEIECDHSDIASASYWESDEEYLRQDLREYVGITREEGHRKGLVTMYEFWGDIILDDRVLPNHRLLMMNDKLVLEEPCEYECGRPFVWLSLIETPRQPYGLGIVQPNLGMLHQLSILTNQRLDNLELASNVMWQVVDDGLNSPEEITSEPGKVYRVSQPGNLQPIPPPPQAYTATYQEYALLEQLIDKSFGTGAYVGSGQGRGGERVTAAEIAAVREAGGNRLSAIHKSIEDTALSDTLEKVFQLIRQFTLKKEIVRVANEDSNFAYYEIDPEDLNTKVHLTALGSEHVMERQRYIQDRVTFLTTVSQVPQMAQLLNYERILKDLLMHWGFSEPEAYLNPPKEEVEMNPQQQLLDSAKETGGQSLQSLVSNHLQADGGMSLMGELGLTQPGLVPTDDTANANIAADVAAGLPIPES